jgi:Interferon-induced transmembrane protein.
MNQPYQNLYQSGVPYSTPPVSPTDSINPTFVKHLILSIFQIIFCPYTLCIPLILTISANSSWKRGDYEAYRNKAKVANVFLIIGWC